MYAFLCFECTLPTNSEATIHKDADIAASFTKIEKFTKDVQLREKLLPFFPHTPKMFWSEHCVDHNGFFGCHTSPKLSLQRSTSPSGSGQNSAVDPEMSVSTGAEQNSTSSTGTLTSISSADRTSSMNKTLTADSHTTWTYFRLLVKMLKAKPPPPPEKDYSWYEMAFLSFSNAKRTMMICFDMPEDAPGAIESDISKHLEDFQGPFGLHVPVLEHVVKLYDISVWGMTRKVRGVEKVS